MHYTAMWAVRIQGKITYAASIVLLSIVIAAIAVLLLAALVDHPPLRGVAALIMGAAITGMNYTGMAAVQLQLDSSAPPPTGVKSLTFLFPVLGLAVLALAIPIYAVLMTATWSDNDDPHSEDLPKSPGRPAPWSPHKPSTGRDTSVA